jgi:hypothetical protein
MARENAIFWLELEFLNIDLTRTKMLTPITVDKCRRHSYHIIIYIQDISSGLVQT